MLSNHTYSEYSSFIGLAALQYLPLTLKPDIADINYYFVLLKFVILVK